MAFHVPEVIVPTLDKLDSVVTAVLTKIPEVGRVTDVVPVTVSVVPNAPLIVKVLAALLATPVPPLAGGKISVTPAVRLT